MFSNVLQAKKGQKHKKQNRFDLIGSLIGRNQRVINHDSLYLTIKGLSRGMLSPWLSMKRREEHGTASTKYVGDALVVT